MSGFRQIMKGGFLQPTSDPLPANHGYKKIGILSGLGGEIFTYHFFIPQAASSYLEFVEQMREVEAALQTLSLIHYFSISRNYRNFTQKIFIKKSD